MESGIGTLNEKSIHSELKKFFETDEQYHEVRVGRYIADIKRGNEIIEIQTQQFKNLLGKLNYYTSLGYNVTIVYPIIHEKKIVWLDKNTNEVVESRHSSKKGRLQDIFKELYWIIDYLDYSNIRLSIVMLNAIEYKYLDGYGANCKRGATKIDKTITFIENEYIINSISELSILIPESLPNQWTSSDFRKKSHCNNKYIGSGLKLLREHNVIHVVGKSGNALVYSR